MSVHVITIFLKFFIPFAVYFEPFPYVGVIDLVFCYSRGFLVLQDRFIPRLEEIF